MSKKRRPPTPPSAEAVPPSLVPNPSLNRAAHTGKKTEDELLLQRPRLAQPQPRDLEQAAFTHSDPWRVLRIMGEYVHGFDALAEVGAAVTVFGSARTPESDPTYQAARDLGYRLAKAGFAVITGGGPGIMEAANRGVSPRPATTASTSTPASAFSAWTFSRACGTPPRRTAASSPAAAWRPTP